MPLTDATVTLRVAYGFSAALDLQTATAPYDRARTDTFAAGTGADQADRGWSDQRTLAASASEDLDLAGSLTDPAGATITFARVKLILVEAAAANTNNVVVGGAASNAFVGPFGDATDTIAVRPGGFLLLVAKDATAYAVTAGSGDLLTVTNSAGSTSVTYNIAIIGASA